MKLQISNHPEHQDVWVLNGSIPALTLAMYAIGQWAWPGFQLDPNGIKAYDKYYEDIAKTGGLVVAKKWVEPLKLDILIKILAEYGVHGYLDDSSAC